MAKSYGTRKKSSFAQKRKNPILILMGGGYSEPIDNTVAAFRDLFIAAAKYSL